jgi:UDP-2,4-diacetamido-2,4,6-trideoxy-beta-L-altropyranose hydrolase
MADALKQCGSHIRFVSRNLPEYLRDMLVAKGMDLVSLACDTDSLAKGDLAHSDWLGTSQAQDALATIHALSGQIWDWLIVDHYALDARWESMLRKTVRKILVIDDIADRFHDCDVLLDQNFYLDMDIRYRDKIPSQCQLLLGPRYALLREEFRQLHDHIKLRSGPVKRMLVFFGGVDAKNYTGRTIEVLAAIDISDIYVDVVIGAQHPCLENIESACIQHGFTCHVQTSHMAELMAEADLAIGAGGSASWERCCLGLPALLVAQAENQIEIARALDRYGACVYLGPAETASMEVLRNAALNLLDHNEQLTALSEKSFSLVDGLGVDRICRILGC